MKNKSRKEISVNLPTEMTLGKPILSQIRMLIYGPPKIGKTTLLTGFPNMLLLATEKGYGALKVYKNDIPDWETFKDNVKLIIKGKHKYKTIGIDTGDLLFKQCADYVCGDLDIDHLSDEGYGKAYDMAANEFEKELNKLFFTDYGIIITSHVRVQELMSRIGKTTKTISTLSNQARRIIIPKVSIIGYMKFKLIKQEENSYKERRIISFEPSEFEEAGDRDGKLPKEMPVYKDSIRTYQLFKEYYSK